MLSQTRLERAKASLTAEQSKWLTTYVSEAMFFNELLGDDLSALPRGSRIVEVGSGIGLLSLLVAARGFHVTSVEPESAGFGDMHLLREVVLDAWEGPIPEVAWVNDRVESLHRSEQFRYAFAINVIEHVASPEALIEEVLLRLEGRSIFRFVCPNYGFPYEPHFNFPTLFSKGLTAAIMASKISGADLADPQELWDELSWPTARGIRKVLRTDGWAFALSGDATAAYMRRSVSDEDFAERKGPALGLLGLIAAKIPPTLISTIPPSLLPLIDASVCKYRRGTADVLGREPIDEFARAEGIT